MICLHCQQDNSIIMESKGFNNVTPKNLKFAYNRLKKHLDVNKCLDCEENPYNEDYLIDFIECECFNLFVGAIQFNTIFNHLLANFREYFEEDIDYRCIITL